LQNYSQVVISDTSARLYGAGFNSKHGSKSMLSQGWVFYW